MPNATNIAIYRDDASLLTLKPVSSLTEAGVTTLVWRESSNTKPLMALVTLTVTVEKLKSGVIKLSRKLEVPIMEIIPSGAVNADGRTAAPAVSHVETDIRTRYHHPLSTGTERADSYRIATAIDDDGQAAPSGGLAFGTAVANLYRDVSSTYQLAYGDVNFIFPSA